MAAIGSSNYWEGRAAKMFLFFSFIVFAVIFIIGVIMCKVRLKIGFPRRLYSYKHNDVSIQGSG